MDDVYEIEIEEYVRYDRHGCLDIDREIYELVNGLTPEVLETAAREATIPYADGTLQIDYDLLRNEIVRLS
jgi:hypothetical protein